MAMHTEWPLKDVPYKDMSEMTAEEEYQAMLAAADLELVDYVDSEDDLPFEWGDGGVTAKDTMRVTVFKDHHLDYQDLWLAVHIITDNAFEEAQFAEWLCRAKCYKAPSIDDADLVIFTGGSSDIDPSLYGAASKHSQTQIDRKRDDKEMDIYLYCLLNGIPMVGICRGAQLLHVLNGGKLYQDVDGHYGPHDIWDVMGQKVIANTSSSHHQMCKPNDSNGMIMIAHTQKSRERWTDAETKAKGGTHLDIEAFFYRDTCCLGFQGHPEYKNYNAYSVWAIDQIWHWIVCNPDVQYENKNLRIRSDILFDRIGERGGPKQKINVRKEAS